jgi:CheY-like chemotaxis protein
MTNAHILVVDDNPTNLKLITATLRYAGHRISTASDAEAARQLLKSTAVDLILMDIELPGMDGLTFTRMLKASPPTSHIPVIAVTASAMRGDEDKALAAGCDCYITKPVNTRTLPGQIADFLAQYRPPHQPL